MVIHFELKRLHFIIAAVALSAGFAAGYFTARCTERPAPLPTQILRQDRPSSHIAPASGIQEDHLLARAAQELGLTDEQKAEVAAIVNRNFPRSERSRASVDIAKVYNTVREIQPLLSDEQSRRLDALIVEHIASGRWK